MKKILLFTTGSLLLITVVITGIFYFLSLRTVTFSLENTSSIAIFDSKDKEVTALSSDGDIKLQDGKYYVVPSGENVSTDKIGFTVEGEDETIHINPPLTQKYLKELLVEEMPAIKKTIDDKYSPLSDKYKLDKGTLYHRGEWFGGLLEPKVNDPRDIRDPYRIVLRKEGGEWKVVRRPEYILTSSRYSEVPIDILRKINRIAR